MNSRRILEPRANGGGTPVGLCLGNVVFRGWNHIRSRQNRAGFHLDSKFAGARRRWHSPGIGGPVRCSNETEKHPRLAAARVIYGVAPAMGHNQVGLDFGFFI